MRAHPTGPVLIVTLVAIATSVAAVSACVSEPLPEARATADGHGGSGDPPEGKESSWHDMEWVDSRRTKNRHYAGGMDGDIDVRCTSAGYYRGTLCGVIRTRGRPSWGACGGTLQISRGQKISVGASIGVGPVKIGANRSFNASQSFSVDVDDCDCCALNACFRNATIRPWSCSSYVGGRFVISSPRNETNVGRAVVHSVCQDDDEGCGCVDAGTDAGADGGTSADGGSGDPDVDGGAPPGPTISPSVRTGSVDLRRTPSGSTDGGVGDAGAADAAVASEHSTYAQRVAICSAMHLMREEAEESGEPFTDLAIQTDSGFEHHDLEADPDPFDCFVSE